MRKYGIPFQGSKNRLAERIIALLPSAAHLYDVFAGGCAISHCALMSDKWEQVHISDATNSVELFRDFLEGNVPDGSEWISREEFYRRIDDPYVRIIWSWSNNQRDYIYSKELEPYKKAVHEMIYAPTPNERRLKFREVCRLLPFLLGAGVRTGDIQSMERSQKLYTDCKAQRIPPYITQCKSSSYSPHPYPLQMTSTVTSLESMERIMAKGCFHPFVMGSMRYRYANTAMSKYSPIP